MNSQKIIGIDPDVDKSGVCIVNNMLQIELLTTMDLVDLFALIESMSDCRDIKVIVEAGWMNKTNFHVRGMDSVWKSAKIGSHVGANHEIGRQIIKFCEKVGIECHAIKPKGHKMSALDFKRISGWTKRTNQEMRDAYKIILEAMK
jgi:hypothetical protein